MIPERDAEAQSFSRAQELALRALGTEA
jgi:hypothetical protein